MMIIIISNASVVGVAERFTSSVRLPEFRSIHRIGHAHQRPERSSVNLSICMTFLAWKDAGSCFGTLHDCHYSPNISRKTIRKFNVYHFQLRGSLMVKIIREGFVFYDRIVAECVCASAAYVCYTKKKTVIHPFVGGHLLRIIYFRKCTISSNNKQNTFGQKRANDLSLQMRWINIRTDTLYVCLGTVCMCCIEFIVCNHLHMNYSEVFRSVSTTAVLMFDFRD